MRIEEVDRRWGSAASTWVWVTGPMHVFEEDGTPSHDLLPVDHAVPGDFEDDHDWWTCHPDTRMGDLAVLYRSGARNDAGRRPAVGPKDLCQVMLATSDAFPLADDPLAGRFSGKHGCRYAVVAQFSPPIGIGTLREDPVTKTWPALRAGFVQGASAMPGAVWRRLVELAGERQDDRPPPRRRTAAERRAVERRLERWLAEHLEVLEPLTGGPVELVGTQWHCGEDHGGIIDLLLQRPRRRGSLVVVELKADVVTRDAVAQALGYVGWLREQRGVEDVSSVVIGLGEQQQVPWVLSMLRDEVAIHHWDELDLPAEVRALLDERTAFA